jgi:hypothetical protein
MKLAVMTGPEDGCGALEELGVEYGELEELDGRGKKYEESDAETAEEEEDGGGGGVGNAGLWFCEFGTRPDEGVRGGMKAR